MLLSVQLEIHGHAVLKLRDDRIPAWEKTLPVTKRQFMQAKDKLTVTSYNNCPHADAVSMTLSMNLE